VLLHSKCVVVDERTAFITSANFTHNGQARNIETGVLIEDEKFAGELAGHWHTLIGAGLLLRYEAGAADVAAGARDQNVDAWNELRENVPREYLPLFDALEARGLPPPSDALGELLWQGRVSDGVAWIYWETLQAALDAPWDRWRVFLHPDQRELVERPQSGPARVTGGAGTGKTVVALHRAAFLARSFPRSQLLLTTFSRALAVRLEHSLKLLLAEDPAAERISVQHLHAVASRIALGPSQDFTPASSDQLAQCIEVALKGRENDWLDAHFARSEWDHVVDAHGITGWDDYKAVSRKGRGLPLSAKKRTATWAVLEAVHAELQRRRLGTFNLLCASAAEKAASHPPYQHVIVDECQDFGPAELRLLRALCEPGENDLFFCGDEGQRIYKPQVSWLSLGIDVRGRSKRLELNYRTTEQIRRCADALLPEAVTDGDGQSEDHRTRSVLSGPPPELQGYRSVAAERDALAAWLRAQRDEGMALHEIAIFARTGKLIAERVTPALRAAGLASQDIKSDGVPEADRIAVGTMHGAKGLEFRAVAIVGCDRNQLPLRSVASRIRDSADRAEFVEHERHLLYVACTRARERLRVTWSGEGCQWLAAR
jgi:superfamily I DNA/RNA helicase